MLVREGGRDGAVSNWEYGPLTSGPCMSNAFHLYQPATLLKTTNTVLTNSMVPATSISVAAELSLIPAVLKNDSAIVAAYGILTCTLLPCFRLGCLDHRSIRPRLGQHCSCYSMSISSPVPYTKAEGTTYPEPGYHFLARDIWKQRAEGLDIIL